MVDEDNTYVLGIDEAGRGPVIGPMVITGIIARISQLSRFDKLVVKDSKKYTPRQREALSQLIRELANDIIVKIVEPREIDKWVEDGDGLNEMEAFFYASIINEAVSRGYNITLVYVDACDTDPERFRGRLSKYIEDYNGVIISEHKADENYSIVASASIIAKTIRDREIDKLKKVYGEIGSGYPSDPKTREFLEKHWREGADIIRRSWKPYKTINRKKSGEK